MAKLKLEIYTPFGHYLSSEADEVLVQTNEYLLGILPHHAPLVATLKVSCLTIKNDGEKDINFAVGEGVLNIDKEKVNLLLDSIERKDEIDIKRAEASRDRALKRLNSNDETIDVLRAKASLYRATNRINIFYGQD